MCENHIFLPTDFLNKNSNLLNKNSYEFKMIYKQKQHQLKLTLFKECIILISSYVLDFFFGKNNFTHNQKKNIEAISQILLLKENFYSAFFYKNPTFHTFWKYSKVQLDISIGLFVTIFNKNAVHRDS